MGGAGQAAVAGAPKVTVSLTDDGCAPSPATVPAGPTNFEMRNAGAGAVTEAEVMQGDRILGEKENLTPGLSGTFSLRLTKGTYTVTLSASDLAGNPGTATGSVEVKRKK